MFAALRSGGLVFTALFSYKLMMSSLIGKLFYFRPKFASEVRKAKKKKVSKKENPKKKEKNLVKMKGKAAFVTDTEKSGTDQEKQKKLIDQGVERMLDSDY